MKHKHKGYVLWQNSLNWNCKIFNAETGEWVSQIKEFCKVTKQEAKEMIELYLKAKGERNDRHSTHQRANYVH